MSATAEGTSTLHYLLVMAAFGLLVWLVYLPSMEGGFVWDDDAHVTKPELQSANGLYRIWFELGATQQYYPLLHSTFWLEHRLWGDSPLGYHLVNVVLHAIAASLVYLILIDLRIPGALLAAAIFAFHPVHVESVAWISEQKNTLSAVFYLSAMLAYLRFDAKRDWRWYAVALALFMLGLLSKTVTATLPAALLVIFWWQRGTWSWHRDVAPLIPFFVFGAIAGFLTAWVEHSLIGAKGAAFDMTPIERGLVAGRTPWFYFSKLIWPVNLMFVYPRWEISPTVWWQWLFPAATAGTLVILWVMRRHWRAPLAGTLFFVGTLFPALGFLNVYPFLFSYVADHFQYLASLGIIVLFAAGTTLLLNYYFSEKQWVRRSIYGAIVFVLALLTMQQCRTYGNIVTLYETTIERNPRCWLAHLNLGTVLAKSGDARGALKHYEAALQLNHENAEIHSNLGIVMFQLGHQQEGLNHLERAVQLAPGSAENLHDLANALVVVGEPEKAIEYAQRAVEIRPDSAQARYGLSVALIRAGRDVDAIAPLLTTIELDPTGFPVYQALIQAYIRMNRPADAIAVAEQAGRIARINGDFTWADKFDAWLTQARIEHQP